MAPTHSLHTYGEREERDRERDTERERERERVRESFNGLTVIRERGMELVSLQRRNRRLGNEQGCGLQYI